MVARAISLLVAFLGSANLGAAEIPPECGDWPAKPAWQWTDSERLDRRFDERCLAARRALAADESRRNGMCKSSGTITDFIFGTDTPELYLPVELFQSMIMTLFIANPRLDSSARFAQRAADAELKLPDDWSERIEKAAADFIESLRARQKTFATTDSATPAERRKIDADVTESQRANCALRTAALNATRAAFEPQLFDRLLYVAVAPGLCTSGTGERATREWIARGCPEKW